MNLRAGIIGSGFAAAFHYTAIRRIHGVAVEVAGVFSQTESHRKTFASERNLSAMDSADDLIQASDVVHVCTPPATHEALCIRALEAGKSAGLLVRDFSRAPGLANCLRISIGTPAQNERLLVALERL